MGPHTYWHTPCSSTVLLEKLTGLQLVKKFPAFYGTRRFITALTSARHYRWRLLRDASPRNPPPRRSEWGSSLPPDCFVSRGNISHVFCNIIFYRVGLLASRQPPTWRTRVSLLVWVITLDLSGMGDPNSSPHYCQHSSRNLLTTQAPPLRQSRDTFGRKMGPHTAQNFTHCT
jgi:hypothetical protein